MCGLAGIISTEETAFNINHFNILGSLNDERGGDSCGIFIDGLVEYGIKETEMFRCFTEDIDYPKTASIALLHCRKASPGYPVNIAQAQPVIIYKNNKVDFVLMHNGTITNIQTLAIKYIPQLNIKGMSDSQILAQIIYHKGYDVLEEYTGCAVLIIVDYRKGEPTVLMFKGSSCYNEPRSKSERPLYYMYHEGKFYFSSMYTSLRCIHYSKTIYDFPVNELCQMRDNKLFCIRKINRSTLTKPAVINYGSNYNSGYLHNNIYYNKDINLYMLNNALVHGIYTVYPSGYLIDPKYVSTSATVAHQLAFFNGKLLYNEECYYFLESIDDLFTEDVLLDHCPEIIDYFCYNPQTIQGKLKTVDENFQYIDYTDGTFVILFTDGAKVVVQNGISSTSYAYANDTLQQYKAAVNKVYFNFEELEKQIITIISKKLVNLNEI